MTHALDARPIHHFSLPVCTDGRDAPVSAHTIGGTTRIDAAIRARIGLYVGSSVAPSVRQRYRGKGIEPFQAWRRGRGWSADGPEPEWLDDMPLAVAAELLGAYVCEIRLRGANADTAEGVIFRYRAGPAPRLREGF